MPRSTGFELPLPVDLPVDLPERLTLDRFAFLRRTPRGATLQRSDAASLSDPVDRAFAGLPVALGFVADPETAESPAPQT